MNCKQGGLAVVVRDTMNNPGTAHMIGTLFECETLIYEQGQPGWLIKGGPLQCPCCGGAVFGFFDADLQPLRPGPQADTTIHFDGLRDPVTARSVNNWPAVPTKVAHG